MLNSTKNVLIQSSRIFIAFALVCSLQCCDNTLIAPKNCDEGIEDPNLPTRPKAASIEDPNKPKPPTP